MRKVCNLRSGKKTIFTCNLRNILQSKLYFALQTFRILQLLSSFVTQNTVPQNTVLTLKFFIFYSFRKIQKISNIVTQNTALKSAQNTTFNQKFSAKYNKKVCAKYNFKTKIFRKVQKCEFQPNASYSFYTKIFCKIQRF